MVMVPLGGVRPGQERIPVSVRQHHEEGGDGGKFPREFLRVKPAKEGHQPEEQLRKREVHQDNQERDTIDTQMVGHLNQFKLTILGVSQQAPGEPGKGVGPEEFE
jgi:hypothetical protein